MGFFLFVFLPVGVAAGHVALSIKLKQWTTQHEIIKRFNKVELKKNF